MRIWAFAFMAAVAGQSASATHPNFTGRFRQDSDKSAYAIRLGVSAEHPAPFSLVVTDKSLEMALLNQDGTTPQRNVGGRPDGWLSCTFDGPAGEMMRTPILTMLCTARWDGDSIVLKETPSGDGAKPLMNAIDTLSISGDELTWTREIRPAIGPLKFSTYQDRIK